jgi:hypothetical protein
VDEDRHIAHCPRIELVPGDVCETVPAFVEHKGHGLRVALLNLDVDLYAPTRVALECFGPRMVQGGIIVLDEYGSTHSVGSPKPWTSTFGGRFGHRPQIRKFPWHSNPSAYIVLDW